MDSPFLSESSPSLNNPQKDSIDLDSSSSVLESDEIQIKRKERRNGSLIKREGFHKTRTDIVKEVNLKLLPAIQITFVYVVVLSWVYWITTVIMPPFFVIECSIGNNYSLTAFFSFFLIFTTMFEYKHAIVIVKIIEPLSGHNRLGNMQIVKLVLGFLGKLNLYTKYCFVLMAHQCGSKYAWISTGIIILWCASLLSVTIFYYITGGVNFLQLTDYSTLFDLLGKYEIMYLEGEKSSAHMLQWTKRLCLMPVMKLFCLDIGIFIMQILFMVEQQRLNYFVLTSLISSLFTSLASVGMLYIKYKMHSPNLEKEQLFIHCVNSSIAKGDQDEVESILGTPRNFRRFGHEIRAEVFKNCAKHDSNLFIEIVNKYIVKNDGLLQSDTFHAKLINSLRNCKEYPENLVMSIDYLLNVKLIYMNMNKKIRISTGGTILHCLIEDPCFILRSIKTMTFDLIEYVEKLGINVNIEDKFSETAVTLVAKLNLSTLIKSCSPEKLMDLIKSNNIIMFKKEELDSALKRWAFRVVEFLVNKGANLKHQNKKRMNALQIAEIAENSFLCDFVLQKFGIEPDKKRRTTYFK